jgi:hypothetical protein
MRDPGSIETSFTKKNEGNMAVQMFGGRCTGVRTERSARNSTQERFLVAGQPEKNSTINKYLASQDHHNPAAYQPENSEFDRNSSLNEPDSPIKVEMTSQLIP